MGLDPLLWHGKRVLVTGHTGFKGSWLTLLLKDLGAEVVGISLRPESLRSVYNDANIGDEVYSEFFQDIRDARKIMQIISELDVDYVFHLAAQAFVRRSVRDPIETITTNVVGTANILISSLASNTVQGVTIATTDKVYENLGTKIPFKESDHLGGNDPYSGSKAASELIVTSIISSSNPLNIPVTTVRAGNVIGGGDWGEDRIVPDLIRTIISNSVLTIRNQNATRPWQHVLDCLYGYLLVAQSHLEKDINTPVSVNFGPNQSLSVIELVNLFEEAFEEKIRYEISAEPVLESKWLTLDSSLAHEYFNWTVSLPPIQAVKQTADWYWKFTSGANAKELIHEEIANYKVNKW